MNWAKLRLGVLVAGVGCATLGGCLVTFEHYVYGDDAGTPLPDSSTTGGSGGSAGASTGGASFGGGGGGGASAGAAGNGGAAGAGGAPAPLDSPCVAHPGSSAHVRSIAAGNAHTCVVRCDDTAACWGSNSNGQLGGPVAFGPGVTAGPTTVSDSAATLAGVQDIAAGVDFSCARTADNVYCWGRNNTAQLGFSGTDQATATPFSPALVASALAIGRAHACAITGADHRVQCWGSNVASQLGRGSTAVSGPAADVLVAAAGAPLTDVTAIAASGDHTCAWNSVSNEVLCWGRNQARESGGCCAAQYDFPAALPAPDSGTLASVTALTAGPFYSCALAGPEHTLWCWGDDASNQWGGAHAPSGTPVSLLAGPTSVSAGGSFTVAASAHACGVFANRAYCWGSSDSGRLGNGDTSGTPTNGRVSVTLSQGVVSVAAGGDHACAVLADGKLACWGKNTSWQVTGRAGTAFTVPFPVTLTNL